jgi:hypothetical protein
MLNVITEGFVDVKEDSDFCIRVMVTCLIKAVADRAFRPLNDDYSHKKAQGSTTKR